MGSGITVTAQPLTGPICIYAQIYRNAMSSVLDIEWNAVANGRGGETVISRPELVSSSPFRHQCRALFWSLRAWGRAPAVSGTGDSLAFSPMWGSPLVSPGLGTFSSSHWNRWFLSFLTNVGLSFGLSGLGDVLQQSLEQVIIKLPHQCGALFWSLGAWGRSAAVTGTGDSLASSPIWDSLLVSPGLGTFSSSHWNRWLYSFLTNVGLSFGLFRFGDIL